MKTYGVTGGIGMGKSTLATLLAGSGVGVVDTDELARQVVRPGEPALAEIQTAFGASVFDSAGELNREALAAVVFQNEMARKQLEAILHPRIQQLWQTQLTAWRKEGRAQAVVVIPLLFETGVESEFDLVVCLACSSLTQRERLAARGWSPEQIQQRNSAQMPVTDKMTRAHRVIWSEGNFDALAAQCERVFSLND